MLFERTENRRKVQGGGFGNFEWTCEGGAKVFRVVSDGFLPLHGRAYDSMPQSGRFSSIWVVPQKFRLLSHCLGQGLFVFAAP